MPLEAFEKLNEQKRQKLITSAIIEFSDNPYDRVSIFNIAKNAEMSRSGIYYYFTCKEDIYEYLLKSLRDEFEQELTGKIDILELPNLIFNYFANKKGTPYQAFISRVLENMKPSVQCFFTNPIIDSKRRYCGFELTGFDKLKVQNEEDMRIMGYMVFNCITVLLQTYYSSDYSLKDIAKKFELALDFIKYGVISEDAR